MTKRIQFTVRQLNYLTSILEKQQLSSIVSHKADKQLLIETQDDIMNKLFDGYERDEHGNIITEEQ